MSHTGNLEGLVTILFLCIKTEVLIALEHQLPEQSQVFYSADTSRHFCLKIN